MFCDIKFFGTKYLLFWSFTTKITTYRRCSRNKKVEFFDFRMGEIWKWFRFLSFPVLMQIIYNYKVPPLSQNANVYVIFNNYR
jgi:hypothetical protein